LVGRAAGRCRQLRAHPLCVDINLIQLGSGVCS
jgi:hypothetical protein